MVAAGSITVVVRVRPPTSSEAARLPEPCYDTTIRGDGTLSTPKSHIQTGNLREVVQVIDDRILTFDPDEKDRTRAFMERGFLPPGTKRYKDRRFMFDRVFDYETRQQHVYESTSQPLLNGLFDGFNATVFAYGATGCGKTHTISGTESDPGLIYLTMADLFQRIAERREDCIVDVSVTFLEIYNEEIRDLLADPAQGVPRGGLSIREDKSVKVVGLNELKPKSADEVKEIVLLGNTRRTQSPTHANETSSRSHAVLQVHITQAPRTADVSEQRTVATLSIIDLAGSERAAATMNMGKRMVEGANINKSLLALGNCINALCESGGAIRHVPYRNSKLTRLLKFSLGGNCKTVMIVCVAPTSLHFDDTHNTLIYAERATKIKTKVVTRNVVNVDRHVGQYVEAINRLNAEIAELKAKVAGKRDSDSEVQRRKKAEAAAEVERSKKDVRFKFDQTKESIVDGAACYGKIVVANLKLAAIRARLSELDNQDLSRSPDLQAERALLSTLAVPEEEVVKPGSSLTTRIQRSSNSRAMFDATMRAVSERRSEKLDDLSLDLLKAETAKSKAEIEAMKAVEEKNAMKDAVEDLAQLMVSLVGMLGRCTVAVGDAAKALDGTPPDDLPQVGTTVANLLLQIKGRNDESFTKLVGHSTEGYTLPPDTHLSNYNYSSASFARRISSAPSAPIAPVVADHVRVRRDPPDESSTSAGSPRRTYRTPRKSLRSGQPYRRISDKKPGKSVQWRDEVGRGDLDDAGGTLPMPPVRVVPASPTPPQRTPNRNGNVLGTPVNGRSTPTGRLTPTGRNTPTAGRSTPTGRNTPTTRPASRAGSESEWEDEEKTEENINLSLLQPSRSKPSYGTLPASRRPQASRTDFNLKSKMPPTLGSLAEDDDEGMEGFGRRVSHPLAPSRLANTERDVPISHQPRAGPSKANVHSSPRRQSVSRTGSTPMKSRRRPSAIGSSRSDKPRRRSSLIPQLSPPAGEGRRRAVMQSPKRPKRMSLASRGGVSSIRLKPTAALSYNSSMSIDTTGDTSFTGRAGSSRPTWR